MSNITLTTTIEREPDICVNAVDQERYYELEIEVEAGFDPGYPAPPCSNPDSSAYSDPGDPGSFDVERVKIISCVDHTDDGKKMPWLKEGSELPESFKLTNWELYNLKEDAYEKAADYDGPEYEPDDRDYGPRDIND